MKMLTFNQFKESNPSYTGIRLVKQYELYQKYFKVKRHHEIKCRLATFFNFLLGFFSFVNLASFLILICGEDTLQSRWAVLLMMFNIAWCVTFSYVKGIFKE